MDAAPAAPPYTPPPMTSAPQTRPTGVTVLAVLAIIAGVFAVFAGFALMAIGAMAGAIGMGADSGMMGMLGAFGAAAGVLVLLYGAFCFAVSYGLFKRMRWAWFATMVIAAFDVLSGIFSLISFEIVSAIFSLAIGGLIAWYLLSPPVQRWFGVNYNTPWKYSGAMG